MTEWSESDQQMMRLAIDLAREAGKAGEVPIAAVVSRNEEVISTAMNRKERQGDATAHAELLAIQEACRKLGLPYLENCCLYVSLEPCAMCAGAIVHARVPRLVFAASDPKTGACGSITNIFQLGLNHTPLVQKGLMEEEASKLLKEFFQKRRAEQKERRAL